MLETLNKQYKLQVIEDLGMEEKNGGSYSIRKVVLFCPMCNSNFTVYNNSRNKQRVMCGNCLKAESVTAKYPRLYNIWKGMRHRVNSTDTTKSKSYKDKGITVCEEWQDFLVFKDWALSNGYADNLSIDRRNNDGNYEPGNCRWTTNSVQSSNTRVLNSHNTSGYRGINELPNSLFHSYITVDNTRVNIGYYDTALEAAKARDTYVIEHNLPHTLNNVLTKNESVNSNREKTIIRTNKSGYRGVSFIKRLKGTKKPYFTQITINTNDRIFSKYAGSAKEAAFLREHFIRSNPEYIDRLKHNFTYEEYEQLKTLYLV